ncbi:MAG: pyruvate kinase [Pirellulaceae bacterium]|nr:pyruvate kinase [Pirellulaceae bacterium]
MLQSARTKIVATVGPACGSVDQLSNLIRLGVDVFRLNMAHGDRARHQAMFDAIATARDLTAIDIAVLVDLAGPKIRLGDLFAGDLDLAAGDRVDFVIGTVATSSHELTCTYEPLVNELEVGQHVLLSDGLIRLQVECKTSDRAACRVIDGGVLRGRQGVNVPGAHFSAPALDVVDLDNARWAVGQGVEYLSLSFVRRPEEILQLKELVRAAGGHSQVIAKIEKREALDCLDEIVKATDGVMVARGDLGVEIEVQQTPIQQKRIVAACRKYGKPVIVATQMLESMHTNRRPTRAEVSDVANAILDGADACMLSGETAIGHYPSDAVTMMNRIMLETERAYPDREDSRFQTPEPTTNITRAMVQGAGRIARQLSAQAVVIVADSIAAARYKSQVRDFIPTIALSGHRHVVRGLALYWGILPYYADPEEINGLPKIKAFIAERAKTHWQLQDGDRVLLVIDSPDNIGEHDWMTVLTVGRD